MKRADPLALIAVEIVALLVLWICLIGLVAFGATRGQPTPFPDAQLIAAHPQVQPSETPTLLPTESTDPPAAITLLPTTTPTQTPTPDPVQRLYACGTIDRPGQYVLAVDILDTSGEGCIRVQSSQVKLDCEDHSIQGSGYRGNAIAILRYGLINSIIPSDVEVLNCRVSHFHDGIYVQAGRGINLHENYSSENYDDADRGSRFGKFLGMAEGAGIRLDNTTDSSVWANTTLTQAIGIDVRNSNRVVIRGNDASDNSAWGINVVRTRESQFVLNRTRDNVRQCTWGAGVIGYGCDAGGIMVQDGSSKNLISENRVLGRNGNGIFIKSHALPCGNDNSIIGNTIEGALYNSIELAFCSGNKINNNIFRDGLDAVWLGYARDTEIKGNTIENMKNHGIIMSNSHDVVVSENHIVNSNVGLYVFSEKFDRTMFYWLPEEGDYWSHDNCLCGNVFLGNNVSIHLNDTTNNRVTNNDFRGNGRGVMLQGNTRGNQMDANQSSLRPDKENSYQVAASGSSLFGRVP